MARITASSATGYLNDLEDDKPYRASIARMEWETSQFTGKPQLVIYWALDDDPDVTLREYVNPTPGTQPNGQPSKLCQILNAIGNQPKTRKIVWFDGRIQIDVEDETLEWSYDGDRPYARLEPGLPLILRGETIEKQTENGPKKRFVITGYRPAGMAQHPADNPKAKQRPAVVKDDDEDEIPF